MSGSNLSAQYVVGCAVAARILWHIIATPKGITAKIGGCFEQCMWLPQLHYTNLVFSGYPEQFISIHT